MALLILSPGMFAALAASMAARRRGFPPGSAPPIRAAIVISLMILVKILPRLASWAPLTCLILLHLEWPDIPLLPEGFQRLMIAQKVGAADSRGERPIACEKKKARTSIMQARENFPAMAYSSTPSPVQYHRRWRA